MARRAQAARARRPARALGLLPALALAGCYAVGFEPIDGLRELAVPTFGNETLRREVEHALTRHVRRELLETTPIALAREGDAERALRGTVLDLREGVLIAGPAQEVVHTSVTVTVSFGVYDRAGALVHGEDRDGDGRPDGEFVRTGYAELTPARGETREAAIDECLRDLAELVVAELGARHDDRHEPNQGPAQAPLVAPGRQVGLILRDEDWFRVEVPPGRALHVTLFVDDDETRLALTDAAGAPLPGAEVRDEGRLGHVPDAGKAQVVLLRVDGPHDGRRYELLVRLGPGSP